MANFFILVFILYRFLFKALGDNDINIEGISSSVSSVTCLIHADDLEKAVAVLRQAFILP